MDPYSQIKDHVMEETAREFTPSDQKLPKPSTSMLYWWPKICNLDIPQPKTIVVPVDMGKHGTEGCYATIGEAGEWNRDWLEPYMDQLHHAAKILGVRTATLSDLLNEKARLSPEMALRLEKAFGVSMETLLRMQAWHDAVRMREKADEIDVERFEPSPAE